MKIFVKVLNIFLILVGIYYILFGFAGLLNPYAAVLSLYSPFPLVIPFQLVDNFIENYGQIVVIFILGIGIVSLLSALDIWRGRKTGYKTWFFLTALFIATGLWNIIYLLFNFVDELIVPSIASLIWAIIYLVAYRVIYWYSYDDTAQ